jgi:hypothetical protein
MYWISGTQPGRVDGVKYKIVDRREEKDRDKN